jgi:hypothetical protein
MPMTNKTSKTVVPFLHKLIKTEIAGSGLKVGSGFLKAIEGYAKYHKLKGKKAETVKAYLAAGAIHIAKPKKGIFSFGVKQSMLVTPRDVKATVLGIHIPAYLDDPCRKAAVRIESMEKARRKGTMGMLTPGLSKHLDTLK